MDRIDPETKVADVVDRYPETVDVFLRHDCPDMRTGLFRAMSHVMSVRWAAWVHGIPLEELIRDLNDAAGDTGGSFEQTGSGGIPGDATNQR